MNTGGSVLITGANRGLGRGVVDVWVSRGWRVFAGCRHPAEAAEVAANGAELVAIDVSDDQSVTAAFVQLAERTRALDVLINNAGINPAPRDLGVADVQVSQVADALDVNLLGVLRVTQAALPLLRRAAAPRVINISSGVGSLAHPSAKLTVPAYAISKAALNMLTRCAARDLPGITVVSVSPGWIRTDMGGPNAELDVAEAANTLVETITHLSPTQTGLWLDRFGRVSKYAW